MVVFGGTDDIGPFDEVWSVDLTISPTMWTQIMITGPFARAEHSAVYDPTGQRMIAFGGQDPSVPGTYFADVWELSLPNPAGIVPLAWSPVSASGGPTARFGHSAVLNGSKMMVFGGDTGTATGEMWQLNLGATSTWNPVTLGSPAPAARLGHRAIFIGATSTMVLFGGGTAPATPAFNDVWEFGM
jgi:hypothetical protein